MKVCSICRSRHEDSTVCPSSDVSSSELHKTPTDLISGFHLLDLLDSGSSHELHRAKESGSGRPCLIRIVRADDDASAQFLRDAKVAIGIFHPSIASVYDAGRLDDDRCFVVSEELEGKSLRDVLDHVGAPALLDSIDIVRQTAEALHALHIAGLLHGSLNPANIVLSMKPGSSAKVSLQHMDLGRLRQRSIISNRFLIDSELDSLSYFSPEQCSGEDPSVQCDVYSLGVVFYEMLAGAPPFDAPNAVGLIHQHRNQPPPEFKIDNFNLRMLVTHALNETLQKHARLRQSSANTFARQLRHIEQLATHASTPPPAVVVRQPASNRRAAVASPVVNLEPPTVISHLDAEPQIEVTKPVDPTKAIFVAPRSRLKLWKKKLHTIAARIVP